MGEGYGLALPAAITRKGWAGVGGVWGCCSTEQAEQSGAIDRMLAVTGIQLGKQLFHVPFDGFVAQAQG